MKCGDNEQFLAVQNQKSQGKIQNKSGANMDPTKIRGRISCHGGVITAIL